MIRKNFGYKAKFPKEVSGGKKLVFSITNKQKDGQFTYMSVMTDLTDDLKGMQDSEEVKIKEIEALDTSEYNGKKQFTIYGKVVRVINEVSSSFEDSEESDGTISISNDDLPF